MHASLGMHTTIALGMHGHGHVERRSTSELQIGGCAFN
jgi:hypothetical protein